MVLKATVEKESPEQSLPKVISEAAIRRCSSKQVFLEISKYSGDFQFSKFYNVNRALEPNKPGTEYAVMI